jgi:hypothetical protein
MLLALGAAVIILSMIVLAALKIGRSIISFNKTEKTEGGAK